MSDSSSTPSPETSRLVDDVKTGLDDGLVPLRIFNDEEIHRRELERVFGRGWVFIGHESEIPDPGDYARRYVGNDPFIFVRDEAGEMHVLLDSCRHRGTQLCRADHGNTSHFRCPYHGWTYKTNGDLVGVPKKQQAYDGLDTDEFGLVSAPQVDSYRGMVFASLDDDAPALADYLGELTWYLDMTFDLTAGGMEVVGDPQRHVMHQNWKSGPENSAGDGYHTQVTHKSVVEAGFMSQDWSWEGADRFYEYIHDIPVGTDDLVGHSMLIGQLDHDEHDVYLGYPDEVTELFGTGGLTADQREIVRQSTVQVTSVFPNLTIMHQNGSTGPHEDQSGYLYVRKWRPIAPDKTESWIWYLAPKESSKAYKKRAYQVGNATFGPTGSFDQDDTAVWEGIASSAGSVMARSEELQLNYQMGMDGVTDVEYDQTWPGPGRATRDMSEGYARNFYDNWHALMTRGE